MRQPFKRLTYTILFLLSVPFLLYGSISASTARKANDSSEVYRIGRDDLLEITVWQSPDLTRAVPVNSRGNIEYSFLGEIAVAGLTTQEVERILREKLSQGYVNNPQVSVSVKEYNSKKILVFGDVGQPGLYKLKGKLPLLEILFLVGGVKADAKRMTVIRPVSVSEDAIPSVLSSTSSDKNTDSAARAIEIDLIALLSRGDLSQNVVIKPGDTIYVSSGTGQRFYVLGRVGNPGPYEWVQDITVLEAIKMAGGATEKAALNRIMIRKQGHGKEDAIKLNVVDIMKGKKKDDMIIKPGDVIVIPESWI